MSHFRTLEVSHPKFESNGLRCITVKSPALKRRADITLFVPEEAEGKTDLPLAILLHGVYGSHWNWTMVGGAHQVAGRLIKEEEIQPIALAMPSDGLWGDGSGYLQHADADYEKCIVEEVPQATREVEPSVTVGSRLFICGLSMGGFGALRLGAKYPQRFAAISGHSSITRFDQMKDFVEEPLDLYGLSQSEESSVIHWMRNNKEDLPPIRFDCGTEDSLLEANRTLDRELTAEGIEHAYEEFPGAHSWEYWHDHLRDSLIFFDRHLR
ncbi:MAG: esterase family protein [Candidatus Omnitrophica bacterium]|nr:esterase family protein [Candidatus Omnitrophota bacterium]